MPKIKKTCQFCSKSYEVFPCFDATTKYCSRLCGNRANAVKLSQTRRGSAHHNWNKRVRLTKWAQLTCVQCGKDFECEPNQYKNGRRFCSRECTNASQQTRGCNSKRVWIKESINLLGKNCEKCRSNDRVEVHHIDRNRRNNPPDGSNWMRLCAKCHRLIHKITLQKAPIISREEFLNI